MPPKPPVMLTSFQVAVRLKCSTRTVHRMAANGELEPAQKLPGPNGAFLFAESDVERLERQRGAA